MVAENILAIQKKINQAASSSGRNPDEITLIAVTKTVGLEKIREAVDAGLRIFGENRVQEAQAKISNTVPHGRIEWHLIGHLQKNKSKSAVELFDLIHTVDSIGLAEDINRHAEKIQKVQRVLAQVKLSEEETKYGVSEKGLSSLLEAIGKLKNLRLEGLMTIPPFFEDPGKAKPYFRRLRALRDGAETAGHRLRQLSMGMSNDFEVAIEEGATMVRIGTAIFGGRSS